MDRPASLLELVQSATTGFDHLLNNELAEAKRLFEARQDASVPHAVGAGMAVFLQAALGQEDAQLSGAMDTLVKAEALAVSKAQATKSTSQSSETSRVYPGLEYKILTNDAVLGQALCHVLTESYLEFMKCLYKMNRAYKGFKQIYQIVFPGGVKDTDNLDEIFARLNNNYAKKTRPGSTNDESSSSATSLFGWGRKKSSAAAAELKPSSSATALPSLNRLQLDDKRMSSSEPVSVNGSPLGSEANLVLDAKADAGHPAPLWADDPLTTLTISGCAFGFGLFGLILSLLPPRMRKLISWFGFNNSNRAVALKLLTVSASTGNDVHGYFASLALLTFYCVVLLQAKLHRMRHETQEAIQVVEEALSHGSSFREADSLLVFELGWLYLSDAQWIKSADAFERMCTLNSWSHSTYLAIAAGALLDLPREEQTPEIKTRIRGLLDKLPTMFGQKRLLGEPPTTELFIQRRMVADKAKHARWVAAERLEADTHFSEVIRITYAYILGCFWATIGGRSPPKAIEIQIQHLANMTPRMSGASMASPNQSTDELDTIEELVMRDVLLGALYRSQETVESLQTAKKLLQSVVDRKDRIREEKWTVPFSLYELAVCECKGAELEQKAAGSNLPQLTMAEKKTIWVAKLKKADSLCQEVLTFVEYDLKSRLESRVIMLREEIATKTRALGL
ncbi:Mitochondrial outer membrane protein iml2 [Microbotryomycetes sp. JL221]|nr:Mitochondrial outer membrane protein iml2 [Microbotryomycetes sp. JL221]